MKNNLYDRLKSILDTDSTAYKDQLKSSEEDFYEYCKPGSVNNWQHPQKPPFQASMALVAKEMNPKRILDFGTGLTAYTLLKNTQSEIVSIDDSLVWLLRLERFLKSKNMRTEGLTFITKEGLVFNLEKDLNSETRKISEHDIVFGIDLNLGENCYKGYPSYGYMEPQYIQTLLSWKEMYETEKWESFSNLEKMDCVHTKRYLGYTDGKNLFPLLNDSNKTERISDLEKFSFVQFDFGNMWARTAYLECAISMLDRSQDSIIMIDDLQKKDIYYKGKKFFEIATEKIHQAGGFWMNCKDSTVDFQGGYGDFAYFPASKDEQDIGETR